MKDFVFNQAVEQYGAKNLVFKFDADCLDSSFHHSDIFGFGLVVSGQNTKSCYFVITEERYELKDNYKVGMTSLEQDPYVPNQNFYISDFERLVNDGHASVYVITPDGIEPVHVTLTDIASVQELRAAKYVEDNFFLLQPFLGEQSA